MGGGSGLACTLAFPAIGTSHTVHQTFRPTHSGVEDHHALERGPFRIRLVRLRSCSPSSARLRTTRSKNTCRRRAVSHTDDWLSRAIHPRLKSAGLVFLIFCNSTQSADEPNYCTVSKLVVAIP